MTPQKRDLIIVGFSGFGKEVFWLAERLGVNVRGFLDDNPETSGKNFGSARVLGGAMQWQDHEDCDFIIAIGNPRIRKKVFEKMSSIGSPSFATLIDPAAVVMPEHFSIGPGSVICAGSICTVEVSIGAHVIINLNCTIGHETCIDDFATIAPMVAISGNVRIGECAEVGTGASIRQGLNVNAGAMIGMGSVLTKNVAENTVVFGSPAKPIKTISG